MLYTVTCIAAQRISPVRECNTPGECKTSVSNRPFQKVGERSPNPPLRHRGTHFFGNLEGAVPHADAKSGVYTRRTLLNTVGFDSHRLHLISVLQYIALCLLNQALSSPVSHL